MRKLSAQSALIVVDVQNDFCPGGALAVEAAHEVVPLINRIAPLFARPRLHPGLASARAPVVRGQPSGGRALLADARCPTARRCCGRRTACRGRRAPTSIPTSLTEHADVIIRKGSHPHIDSYSTFFENDRTTPTGLAGYLRERGVTEVWLAGLATDFCVALLGARRGRARLLGDGDCWTPAGRSTSTGRSTARWREMRDAGVRAASHRRPRRVRRHDRHRDAGPRPQLAHRPDRALAARHRLLQAPDAADGLPPACRRHRRVQPDQPHQERAARPADPRGGPAGAARPHPHAAADARRVDLAARQHLLRQAPDVRRRRHAVAR